MRWCPAVKQMVSENHKLCMRNSSVGSLTGLSASEVVTWVIDHDPCYPIPIGTRFASILVRGLTASWEIDIHVGWSWARGDRDCEI